MGKITIKFKVRKGHLTYIIRSGCKTVRGGKYIG